MRRRPLPRAIRPLPRPFVPADRRRDVLVLPGARLHSDGRSPGLPPACQAGGRAVRHLRHRNRRHRRLRPNEPFHHRQAAGAVPAQSRVHARPGESPESSAAHRARFGFAHGNGHRPAVLPAPAARRVRLAAPSDRRYRCDLLWPAADIAVEYDSFLHHGSRAKMADDARRRNDLLARGTTVVSITGRTVWNLIELDEIARLLARRMGKRLSTNGVGWRKAQHELHGMLTGSFFDGR